MACWWVVIWMFLGGKFTDLFVGNLEQLEHQRKQQVVVTWFRLFRSGDGREFGSWVEGSGLRWMTPPDLLESNSAREMEQ